MASTTLGTCILVIYDLLNNSKYKTIQFKSFAKVNMHLDIVSRRADGYHDLESIFAKIDLHDDIVVIPRLEEGLELGYCQKVSWQTEQDILYKTYHKYCDSMKINQGLYIEIDKRIPDKAGLGGASSNAAVLLQYLHSQIKPCPYLNELASSIGADVPFFLQDSNYAFVEGIGDKITPISNFNYTNYGVIIVKPDFGISTAEAFASIDLYKYPVLGKDRLLNYFNRNKLSAMHNHFAMSLHNKYPIIKVIKDELYKLGAIYAELTGSGSSVVGYFETPIEHSGEKFSINSVLKPYGKVHFSKLL